MNLFSKYKIKKVFSKLKPSRKFLILTVLILISWGGCFHSVYATSTTTPTSGSYMTPGGMFSLIYDALNGGGTAIIDKALAPIKYLVSLVMLPLVSLILTLSGKLFNISFKETVLKMGENLGEKGSLHSTIIDSWAIFRDVSNILIVFVLIYISIKIILGLGGQAKKMIPAVILVSILINFSLFFAQLPIDLSNVLAIKIHEGAGFKESSGGISEAFLSRMGLNSFFELTKQNDISNANIILLGIVGSVFILILALILFIAAFFFIARYIILIIVLITSAAAVGSLILPQLKSQIWSKWVDNLVGQAVFAPIFIFMLALSLKILSPFSEGQGKDWVAMLKSGQNDSIASILLIFFLTVGFLIASLAVAKTFANKGGGYAGKMTTFMGGAAVGGTAILGRKVGGNLGGKLLDNRVTKNWANSDRKGFMGTLARTTGALSLKAGEKAKKGTWDFRNTSSVSKLLKTTGTDLGSGSKNTVESIKADQKKKYEAAAKRREYTEEEKEIEKNRRKALDAKRKRGDLIEENIAANTDFYNSNSEEDVLIKENIESKAKNKVDSSKKLDENKKERERIEKTLNDAQKINDVVGVMEAAKKLREADKKIKESEEELASVEKELAEAEKLKAAAIEKRINEMRGYVDMDKVKENYYRRKSEDISIGGLKIPLSRGLGRIGGTSNSTLMELYRKERKGETDMDKLMKKVMEEMKKNNSATPPTTPPTTTP